MVPGEGSNPHSSRELDFELALQFRHPGKSLTVSKLKSGNALLYCKNRDDAFVLYRLQQKIGKNE